jgi:uncharacterized ferritin-like protein (DUF455 family)
MNSLSTSTRTDNLFAELQRIILLNDATEKCQATHYVATHLPDFELAHDSIPQPIPCPGYPPKLELVAPRNLKRRGMQSQDGRNVLMHSIAHIEFNAINLALDAAYRFRNQPFEFYRDWIQIADDEARHFGMIRGYLNERGCEYGDYKAHNGLWDMAVQTQDDVVARMALVPRVLEARGLDVTPGIIERLERMQDNAAVDILNIIYQDEIGHVKAGSDWFFYQCKLRDLEPRSTFKAMVDKHLYGQLRGPFNIAARLQAGFDEMELRAFEQPNKNVT